MEFLISKYQSLHPLLNDIDQLYNKKLWHNITEKLEQLVAAKEFAGEILTPAMQDLSVFYERFVAPFELRMNLLKLALIVTAIASKQDPKKALSLLETLLEKIEKEKRRDKERSEALILLKIEIASLKIRLQDLASCKEFLSQAKDALDKEGFVDTAVNSAFYRVKADYLLRSEEFNDFYKHALLFLAYTPLESISVMQQRAFAFDIGIAALVGDKVYNFGELLMHPVIESLSNTQANWLVKMLFAFNKGDINEYKQLCQQHSHEIFSRAILKDRIQFLEDKIQLMSLMEMVFQKSAGNRLLTFAEVSATTGKPLDQVELLLLKALAYNLIKGAIDQVEETIQVSWVQPRVLDKNQITNVKDKITGWKHKVSETIQYLEKEGALQ